MADPNTNIVDLLALNEEQERNLTEKARSLTKANLEALATRDPLKMEELNLTMDDLGSISAAMTTPPPGAPDTWNCCCCCCAAAQTVPIVKIW